MEKWGSDHSFVVNPAVKYPQISWVPWKLIGTDFRSLEELQNIAGKLVRGPR
jgi:hypothetical protein